MMFLLMETIYLQNILLLSRWHIIVVSKHQINMKHETIDFTAAYII